MCLCSSSCKIVFLGCAFINGLGRCSAALPWMLFSHTALWPAFLLQSSPASACFISFSNVHPPPPFSYPSPTFTRLRLLISFSNVHPPPPVSYPSPTFTRLRLSYILLQRSHILLQRSPASACLISFSNVHPPPPVSYPSTTFTRLRLSLILLNAVFQSFFVNATSVDKKKITNISKRWGGGGAGYTKTKNC